MKRIGCILTVGLGLVLTGWASTTYYVAPGGNDDPANPGTNWATSLATISNAVFLARTSDGNLILVSNGTYTVTDQVAITNGTTVAGFGAAATDTFINGNYPATTNRAFHLSHSGAVVDGFTITNCAAGAGGGGGAVYIQDNGRVLNCVLAFNQSTNIGYDSTGGGAVYLNSGGLLTNCVISNNTANFGVGGGAFLYKGGVLSNCTIVANSASNSSGYTGAGAFIRITAASQASRVTGCVFSNNVGLYRGGGLMLYQTAGAVDAALIDDCTCVTNVAGSYGAGVYLTGGGVVSNCILINNKSLEHGGGAYISGGRIINCTNISGNVATNTSCGGGGIYLISGARAENCRVTGNTGKRGGGIRFSGAVVVTGCVISGNTGSDYGGGGVWAESSSGWTIQDCVFSNNNAANYGGGIGVVGVSGNTGLIQRCEFVNNIAGASGGGIDTIGGSAAGFVAVIQDCVFRGNSASGGPGGGGIYYPSGTGRVENCQFTENQSANAWCGAGGYFGAGVQVRNCLFTKNVAVSYAGGAYLGTNGNNGGEFVACTVVSNKGGTGGGLYLSGTNNVVLNSVIYSNTATTSNDLYLASDPADNTLAYNCTPVTLPGQSNVTAYPKFIDPAGGDWRLNSGSPCINVGTNQDWMTNAVDLEGTHARILGETADMGAYEYPLPDALRVQPIAVTTNVIQGGAYVTNLGVWFIGLITNDIYWGMTITSSWLLVGSTSSVIVWPLTNDVDLTNDMLGLPPGAYASRIDMAGTNVMSATYPALTNAVEVAIDVMAPARMPTNQTFTLMQGYAATSRTFQVWNAGAGGMTFAVTTSAWWLSVSPTTGMSTGAVDLVTLTNTVTAGLGLGTYYGEIHVQPDAGGALRAIGVTVSVNPAPELRVSPGAWDLTTAPGLSPTDTTLTLSNASSLYSLEYTIASNMNWVSLGSPATGTLAAGGFTNITVKYQTATLSAGGTYTGALTVAASNGMVTAIGSPQTVAIIVHVSANPLLQTTPAGLTNAVVAGQDAADQYFEVWNGSGTNSLAYTVADNVPWLVMSPASGTSTGQHDRITVRYSTAGLNPGETSAVITVHATDGVLYQATNRIAVTLRVRALAELATTMTDYQATIRQGAPLAPMTYQVWNSAASPRGRLIFSNMVESGHTVGRKIALETTRSTSRCTKVDADVPIGVISEIPNIESGAAWLTVNPGSGTSEGEAHAVTLSFQTAGLGPLPRPHRGVLRITGVDEETGGSAVGSPQEYVVEITVNRGVGLDFTGQGSAAMVVYHEPTGWWYLKDFMTGATWNEQYGGSGLQPVVGDYDGDGVAELGVYAGASAALYVKNIGQYEIAAFQGIGGTAAVPFAGDYDGDGKTDPAVFSDAAGYWWVQLSQSGYASVILNTGAGAGYTPVSGDFDGDGIWDPAVYQGTAGAWYALLSGAGYPLVSAAFGGKGESPVTGDYDGDGLTDLGIFNPTSGVFAVLLSGNGYAKASVVFAGFGGETISANIQPAVAEAMAGRHPIPTSGESGNVERPMDATLEPLNVEPLNSATAYVATPVSGDYDGDGRADPTVYAPDPALTLAPTNGYWQIMLSGNAYVPMPLSFGPRRAQAVGQ